MILVDSKQTLKKMPVQSQKAAMEPWKPPLVALNSSSVKVEAAMIPVNKSFTADFNFPSCEFHTHECFL